MNSSMEEEQRLKRSRMHTPPHKGGSRSSDPEFRVSKRAEPGPVQRPHDQDRLFPSPTKEQMHHENTVFRKTIEEAQQTAIRYALIRNEQFEDAAQRYANYAKDVCRFEVSQTEQMAQNQMSSTTGIK